VLLLTVAASVTTWLLCAMMLAMAPRDGVPLVVPGLALALSTTLLLVAGAWIVLRAKRALDEAARQVGKLGPQDLTQVSVQRAPEELTPMLAALNDLLGRLASTLASERHFASAAAHELRTPLAAIKIQAQVALHAKGRGEQTEALNRLVASIDQASQMVDQLLTLARIDGMAALQAKLEQQRLDAVAARVIADLRPLAARRGQVIADRLAKADVDGLEFGIAMLLRNLVDNAARYGPDGGTIRISTGTEEGQGYVVVEDQGPGIPPEKQHRVFERFYRLPSNAGSEGCGIGLSIVQAVARLHRARIELGRSDLGGLRVSVRFPVADKAGAAG
jgi:signal transduction histidine kinase